MVYFDPEQQPPVPLAPDAPPPQPVAPPAPASPMQDPGFRAFVAQRAQQLQELRDAQAQAAATRDSFGFKAGNFLTTLGEGDTAPRFAQANQPVADVLARQKAGAEATQEGAQQAGMQRDFANTAYEQAKRDPNSGPSRAVQKLFAPILGDRAQYLTAADAEAAHAAGGLDIQRLNAITQQRQLQAQIGHQNSEMEFNKAKEAREARQAQERLDIERGRVQFDQSQKGRVPEQEAQKIVNQGQALKAIDELEKLHGEASGLGMVPIGNTAINRYGDAVNALAGAIAAGALPAARETPALMEEFKHNLPGGMTSHARAQAAFAKLREAVRNNATSQVTALKAGNYNPSQIDELEKQAGGPAAPAATAPAAAPATEVPPGRVKVISPSGQVGHIPPEQLNDALAKGYKRG